MGVLLGRRGNLGCLGGLVVGLGGLRLSFEGRLDRLGRCLGCCFGRCFGFV